MSVDVAAYARALADGIEAALPGWVERVVAEIMTAWDGSVPPEVADSRAGGGPRCGGHGRAPGAGPARSRHRPAAHHAPGHPALCRGRPTRARCSGGRGPPVLRDPAAEELFPDDIYDLVPASFADVAPDLADLGLYWGAAKAFEHKRRHQPKTRGGDR